MEVFALQFIAEPGVNLLCPIHKLANVIHLNVSHNSRRFNSRSNGASLQRKLRHEGTNVATWAAFT
jgi:hypothetical protein